MPLAPAAALLFPNKPPVGAVLVVLLFGRLKKLIAEMRMRSREGKRLIEDLEKRQRELSRRVRCLSQTFKSALTLGYQNQLSIWLCNIVFDFRIMDPYIKISVICQC